LLVAFAVEAEGVGPALWRERRSVRLAGSGPRLGEFFRRRCGV